MIAGYQSVTVRGHCPPLNCVILSESEGWQIVNQVQHFLQKFQLGFSSQDISWDGY